ncbi:hypothetical protein ACO2Q9_14595 [Variovorax sp. VNK109]|uniref:hypothetical protein n=1 Tax=Variovorax sp. VNK109 TaxID=3400919 RepID=UPI003C03ADED
MSKTKRLGGWRLWAGLALLCAGTVALAVWWMFFRPVGHGLTYGLMNEPDASTGMLHLGCKANPVPNGQPLDGGCNPVEGDTACRASRPLLCVLPATQADPLIKEGPLKNWANTKWAATPAVRGSDLTSQEAADKLCVAEFGEQWRAATWAPAQVNLLRGVRGDGFSEPGATRYWIQAPATAANCWARTE